MCRWLIATFAAATSLLSTQAQSDPVRQDFRFRVGDRELTMPVPGSYCEPSGQAAAVAQVIASADKANTTVATFNACNRNPSVSPFDEYVLLKVVNGALLGHFEKTDTLNQIDPVFQSPDMPKFSDQAQADVEKGFGEVLGQKPVMTFKISYMGRDSDCIYLFGNGTVGLNGTTGRGIMVGCMTVAASKLLTVYSYRFTPGSKVADVKAQALAIARSINAAAP